MLLEAKRLHQANLEGKEASNLSPALHHKLRDKTTQKYLTRGDLDPTCLDERENDAITFQVEEEAHDARMKYEQEFEKYGKTVEIEVVSLDHNNQIVATA